MRSLQLRVHISVRMVKDNCLVKVLCLQLLFFLLMKERKEVTKCAIRNEEYTWKRRRKEKAREADSFVLLKLRKPVSKICP